MALKVHGTGNATYAVIQNGYALYGEGATVAAAIADANEWLDEPVTLADLIERTNGAEYEVVIGGLYITDDDDDIASYRSEVVDHLHYEARNAHKAREA